MKKNSFIQGAFIATVAILISKIIGVIYVIPFYPLIGERGGALYGYAYTIYGMFLSISTAGIPFAISRITSEYNALGQDYIKEKTYKLGKYLICSLGLIGFLILFIFSENIAYLFIRNIEGGNTIEDVSFVIRVVSTALLIVPLLSVSRGYLQGQKYITPSSVSQVLEQIVRVTFLLIGSYLTLRVFNLSLTTTVGVSVFAATFGALTAYLYIFIKIFANKEKLNRDALETEEEKQITSKFLMRKILAYSIPFILIDVVRSGYSFVDLSTINKTMVDLGYEIQEAEAVIGILTTWGFKLNSIIFAISTGLIVSLIPNITSSFVTKDIKEVKRKINCALQSLIFVVLPLTIFLSVLSIPVWTVFFGSGSNLGPMIFSFYIYMALVVSIYNTTVSMLHSLGFSKTILFSLFIGLVIKTILNIPSMYLFNSFRLHPSYGVIFATIISFVIAIIINLVYIKIKLKINYKDTINKLFRIILSVIVMIIGILLLKFIIPIESGSRLLSLIICGVYGLIASSIYLFMTIKTKIIYEIFGKDILKKVLSKFKVFAINK